MRARTKALVVLLSGLTLLGTAAQAQRTISIGTLAPPGSTWMRGLDSANRELRRRSNQQLQIRFYAGGVQGDESEMIRKVRAGRLDGVVATGIGLGNIHRPVLAFMLPGMFSNRAAVERARVALSTEVETAFTSQGFSLISWAVGGMPRLFANREIRTPTDLRQTRPWLWRDDVILPAFYAEAGATGVPLALPEVLSALQTHRIDAVVAPPYAAVALQWASQITHMTEGANSYSVGGIALSRRTFESLTPEQRTMLQEVINQFNGLIQRNVDRDDESAIRALRGRGVTLVEYSPAERQQWTGLFDRARARLVGTVSDAAWMTRVRAAGR
jgi:TRAP-type C4-dicarboxylate transport system substrate-binding protein